MFAHPLFRSGAIEFADPNVQGIALRNARGLRGDQEQGNPEKNQKLAANRQGTVRT
jgi:hypothetical protein